MIGGYITFDSYRPLHALILSSNILGCQLYSGTFRLVSTFRSRVLRAEAVFTVYASNRVKRFICVCVPLL